MVKGDAAPDRTDDSIDLVLAGASATHGRARCTVTAVAIEPPHSGSWLP